ncbi:MAG: N-acetyltransferase [Actinobacteria bacterium]|nr:N-acetyltransferase [Actinomycetota bacterium]
MWGEGKAEFSADDWRNFYRKASQGNYNFWDPEGSDQDLIFLAIREDQVVGVIALCDFDDFEELRHLKPWIAAFIVDPKLRGKGVGSEILNLMEEKVVSFGIESIYLWSENQDSFYANRGYKSIDRLEKPGNLNRVIEIFQKALG